MLKDSFHFLRQEQDGTFVECYGIDFEDFEAGQVFEHRPGRTFSADECLRHALHAMDLTPAGVDHEYAKKLSDGGGTDMANQTSRIRVPETCIMTTFAMSTKTFGKVVANLAMTDFHIGEVYAGDTLYYESEILSKRESKSRPQQGIMSVETRAHNQHGQQVVSLRRKFLVYRRGHGPYAAAGY